MSEGGRPAELTEDGKTQFAPQVLHKLESAFLKGMNNREACFLADISESLFYEVCKNNPGIKERFEMLAENVKVQAKQNVYEKVVVGDVETSKWYLERRSKAEFSPRQELSGTDGKDLVTGLTDEQKKKLDLLLDPQKT